MWALRVKGILDQISRFLGLTVGLAAFAIAALVAYSVIARELFGASESGVADISTYLMTYITFVGAAYGLWEGAHVVVHLLTSRLRGRAHAAVSLVANGLLTLVAAVFAWLGVEFWLDAWRTGERAWGTLSVPLWIPYSSMLVGTVLFLLLQLARLAFGRTDFGRSDHETE
jgi:TRAP-type C4-dicarboxylate transport system permease small subunit